MRHSSKKFYIRSFAKINLWLEILEKLPNNFHTLRMIMAYIDLFDDLTIQYTSIDSKESKICLHISGDATQNCPQGSSNIIYDTVRLFLQEYCIRFTQIDIYLTKRIPIQAGLGGGSSNAGKVLKHLSLYFAQMIPQHQQKLYRIAHQLGSDVPFFLQDQMAQVSGTGETIQPFTSSVNQRISGLLVKPWRNISTPSMYKMYDSMDTMQKNKKRLNENFSRLLHALQNKDFHIPWSTLIYNDFEHVVYSQYPDIQKISSEMLLLGAHSTILCGSGSSVLGFFDFDIAKRHVHYFQNRNDIEAVFPVQLAYV